jgi:hypothetical protein
MSGFNMLKINSICVPQNTGHRKSLSTNPRIGSSLLDNLKILGKIMNVHKIVLLPIESARGFYKKNGFVPESDHYVFQINGGRTNKRRI